MEVKKKEGRMEYWSDGVLERGEDSRLSTLRNSLQRRTGANASAFVATLTSADKTVWQGRQNEKHWNSGRLEGWEEKIPPGLPLAKGGDQWERWKNGKGEPFGIFF
jgi:hypothetical protein